jgi:hypothetical protein
MLKLPETQIRFLLKVVSKKQVERFLSTPRSYASVNCQATNGMTPLMTCTLVGDEVGVFLLLLAGADRHIKNARGQTAFDINSQACEKGCGLNVFECSHALIRALLVMRTTVDTLKDTYELGLEPKQAAADEAEEDFQKFLREVIL